ncbi:MAG: hypothetical protein MUE50_18920, partial [Pirellulaceae bacterium]|nr:hypothetical protein [Pirellulaceae bacterium]
MSSPADRLGRLAAAKARLAAQPPRKVTAVARPPVLRSAATADAAKAGEQTTLFAWLACPSRGKVVGDVSGRTAGCGCSSQTVEVYWCEEFREPVLKLADPRRTEEIRKHVPAYAGRICRTCPIPIQAQAVCGHRGAEALRTVPADYLRFFASCDCGDVTMWRCSKHQATVTEIRPGEEAIEVLSGIDSDYHGRSCDRCEDHYVLPTRSASQPLPASPQPPVYRNANLRKPLPERGLISPADQRVVQVEITNRCFMRCSNCTRLVAHQVAPYEMTRDTFCRAVESLADHPGMVGIMGGEPTLHQDFDWLVRHYATVIDPGRKYELLRQPVLDLAKYRQEHCESLDHRRGLWSATGPRFYEHIELISEVFGYWCLNDHRHAGKHQALLMARKDLGVSDERWHELRDRCWIQRTWSSSINPAGAYFCEVAAAIDWTLFGGRHAWPVEPGWWRRTPADFGSQLSLCEYCSAPLSVSARLPAEQRDDVSPTLYQLLNAAGSPHAKAGRIILHNSHPSPASHQSDFGPESYMAQDDGQVDNAARISPDNPWVKPREIVGCLVCVDFSQWLPELLAANARHFDR